MLGRMSVRSVQNILVHGFGCAYNIECDQSKLTDTWTRIGALTHMYKQAKGA